MLYKVRFAFSDTAPTTHIRNYDNIGICIKLSLMLI